jgi:hypothetical protein
VPNGNIGAKVIEISTAAILPHLISLINAKPAAKKRQTKNMLTSFIQYAAEVKGYSNRLGTESTATIIYIMPIIDLCCFNVIILALLRCFVAFNALLTGPAEQSKLVVSLRSKPQACGA